MWELLKVQSSTRYIAAGNHTWLACKELDASVIPAALLDMKARSASTARRRIT